jgi:hypothetical protein
MSLATKRPTCDSDGSDDTIQYNPPSQVTGVVNTEPPFEESINQPSLATAMRLQPPKRTLSTLPCNLIDLRSVGILSRKTRTTMSLRHYMSFSPEPSSMVYQCPSSLVTLGLYTLSTPKAPTSLDQASLRLQIATRGRNLTIGVHPSSGI